MMVSPLQDSVQEQQVAVNEYDAQYERGGEGVVTLVTKSGSSEFHGEVYDYMRNSSFDANTWANNFAGAPKGKLHRNQFGGNFSGPLWRRHNLFFFAGYEGLRQPETDSSGLITVPTAGERGGDFSGTLNADEPIWFSRAGIARYRRKSQTRAQNGIQLAECERVYDHTGGLRAGK
jgi:hypothetical protein